MPLPNPEQDEERKDWMSRCMGDDNMREEFDDPAQRYKVCEQKWNDKDKDE